MDHDTPSRLNVSTSKESTVQTNSPASLRKISLQPSLQVTEPDQSEVSLDNVDREQNKSPVTAEIVQVELYNVVENSDMSAALDSSAVENMSIASAVIVIGSPNCSISIPSLLSIVQSDASCGGSPSSSRRNDQRMKKSCQIRPLPFGDIW